MPSATPGLGHDAKAGLCKGLDEKGLPRGMSTFQTKLHRSSHVSSNCRGWPGLRALFVSALAVSAGVVQSADADPLAVKVGVIHQAHSRETISLLDIPPADDFIAGVRMAMDDNNTTGRFLDQSFSVVDAKLAPDEDPIAPLKEMLVDGVRFFIIDLPPGRGSRGRRRRPPLRRAGVQCGRA